MPERLLRTPPPKAVKLPTKRAAFFVCAGIGAVVCAAVFAIKALTTTHHAASGADPGRIAAGLAGGGVFAASIGAPALKRQAQAREALARWSKERGFALRGKDEARGSVDDVPIAVRIVYGRGPYASRGASELCVTVRPDTPAAGWLADSEPFDDVAVVDRHIERLVAKALRRSSPTDEA